MKSIGVILIVLGLLGFAVTGISYTTSEEMIDVGPLEVQREEERTIPVSPLVSGGAVLVGIGLVVAGRRRGS